MTVLLVAAALLTTATPSSAASPPERGSGFAPTTRAAAQQLYDDLYLDESDSLINWTGSVSGCLDGDTGQTFRDGVQHRINYFRAMAGVPDDIVLTPTLNARAQGAALLMAANQDLDHAPPSNWTCWTAPRGDAAGQSNLAQGTVGAAAIASYMQDGGASNTAVGHRRWLLYPPTQEMGTGDVQMPSWQSTTNALVVFDSHFSDPLPTLRDGYVAWPPPGFVPAPVVYPRWSLSFPNADFTNAQVTMTRDGSAITATRLNPAAGYGLNTLVWEPQTTLSSPATFHVSVTGISGVGVPASVAYDVHTFVPDETPPTVTIRTPGAGRVYRQGATVIADFDCSDGPDGSGVASCSGPVADGQAVDTSTLGDHLFSVTALDQAGRQATVDWPYSVATRPDLSASVGGGGTLVGDGVYDTTIASRQTLAAGVARGTTRTYVARVGNDAGAPATFTLRAAASGAGGFSVKIVRDGVDITQSVLQGTYQITDLAPGATVALKVKVNATTASARGSARTVDLTVSSVAGPGTKDKFRTRTTRT